jgi:glycerol-3-phosphate dehydrogenase
VIGVFAGLRPLVSTDPDSPTTKLSREHVVDSPTQGFVSIAGGKYTTYRVMSEDAVNEAINHLRKIVPDSVTETLAIIGAEGYSVLMNQIPRLARQYFISEKCVEHLLNRYGSLIGEVLEPAETHPELREELIPGLPYLKAEIRYAVTHEGALSIDDVLSRRTRISFEASDQGLSAVDEVAELISETLGWSSADRKSSVQHYRDLVNRQNEILMHAKTGKAKVS